MSVLEFALLGLGVGAVYALLGNGLVLIYRGSGIINFAQGAYAMAGAYTFWELHYNHAQSFAVAFLVAVLATALLGALTNLVVMRRLRKASPLSRMIATLGMMTLLEGIATVRYQGSLVSVPSSLPASPVKLGSLTIPENQLIMLGIAVALAIGLTYLSRHTTFGVATFAVAENRRAAASLGWSPDLVATVTWTIGSALAAVAGILIVPLSGLSADQLSLAVIAAMATALVSGFSSFNMTLVAGIAIGIIQSLMVQYVSQPGVSDAIPFVIIMLVLVARGRSLPFRRDVLERLPRIGTGVLRPRLIVVLAVLVAVGMLTVFSSAFDTAATNQLIVAIILLSVVAITGYAGQLSLAQYGIAGMGGYFAGRLVAVAHWPFDVALLIGVCGAAVTGVCFGFPALRTRGVNLAVVTLGLGFALQTVLFSNPAYTGGLDGTQVGAASFLGINIDPVAYPARYGVFCLACFAIAAIALANLRRGRAGRRMIAVRDNERAAASVGVSVTQAKLSAFAIASGVAGLGGVLLAFQSHIVIYQSYDIFSSINAVAFSTLGGIGYLGGSLVGAGFATGGIGSWILNGFGGIEAWLPVIGGASVLLVLMQNPDGFVSAVLEGRDPLTRSIARRLRARAGPANGCKIAETGSTQSSNYDAREGGKELVVRGLSVAYGAVKAVADVSFTVGPGEVIGLIGPNGAGKTTVIDAISGFTKPASGEILLGDLRLDDLTAAQRSTLGLARTFQSVELFDDLTVRENILVACDRKDLRAYASNMVRPGRDALAGAGLAIALDLDLDEWLNSHPAELPHGPRRLAGIARAVATRPSVLLLDEPASGLDRGERQNLARLVRSLATDRGFGVLLVEHDMDFVMSICDQVVVLDAGCEIAAGDPVAVRRDPMVIAAYLGEQSPEQASGTQPGPVAMPARADTADQALASGGSFATEAPEGRLQ